MILDPIKNDEKLNLYINAAYKQQKYVDTFTPVYCSDTVFRYYNDDYTGLNKTCYSTFDARKDPMFSQDLTREELEALTSGDYFTNEELRYYLDLLVSNYIGRNQSNEEKCKNTKKEQSN